MLTRLLWAKSLRSQHFAHCQYHFRKASIKTPRPFANNKRRTTHQRSHFGTTTPSDSMNSSSKTKSATAEEIELSLADGMVLRGQRWTHPENSVIPPTTKILALHGWLDNCRSFHYLAPRLLEKFHEQHGIDRAELVAIDLPGHGWSSHRPLDGPTTVLSEGAYYIAEIIDALGWQVVRGTSDATASIPEREKVALIGHSMGAGMAITYAGAFPEHISRVVSLDMYGPEPGRPETAASHIRSHVVQRRAGGPKGRPHSRYPSLERAIERRQKAARMAAGGNQYLSLQAATEIVTRSMEAVRGGENDNDTIQGYKFRHDTRLLWPSLQYLTAEQIQSIMEGVECPVCILAAKDGYPFAKDRIDRVISALQPKIHKVLPGSHHLHADPDTADAVVDEICDFFCSGESNHR